jgi:NADH-quinone oxidoreductase subunit F
MTDAELDEIVQFVDEVVAECGRSPSAVIPILQRIQGRFRYLPEPALRRVCETTKITPATVAGVSTFFAQFRHSPAGKHFIRVCIGTACHVKGADKTYDAFKRQLEIPDNEDTDRDRLFTVDKVACLGCCMLAPAVQIDDVVYGFVVPDKVPSVLKDFLAAQSVKTSRQAPDETTVKSGMPLTGEARICLCASCKAGGSLPVYDQLQKQAAALSLPIEVKTVGCTGISYQTPLIEIAMTDGRVFRYGRVKPADVRAILLRHFRPPGLTLQASAAVSGLLERLLTDESWEPVTRYSIDTQKGPDALYVGAQHRIATEYCGELYPMSIDQYIERGGFDALRKCLKELTPDEVVNQITSSQLRGRGGAGFPTGRKWSSVRASKGDVKYIVCNGDEGDPGAFMDRMILESFPFRVIEGIAIAAYAVGVQEAFMYIRAEYPLAVERVRKALAICDERKIIPFSLRISVVEGAGAFVCGEETALLAAVEGRRGMPRFRPPFPSTAGLWGKPTLINNVETFALVPWIIRNGPEAFAAIGTAKSKGSKTFALAGKVLRGGLVEVPMGTSIRQIVESIGGGVHEDRQFKAVQIGGPSGGCIPASLADTAVDYEALTATGAMMGSGGLVVLDDTDCMVDIARYFMTFTQRESCGKCTHCRIGTKRMLELLDRLCEGKGEKGDLDKLEQLAKTTQTGSLCGLGKTAPNPVLSTLKYFRDEYEAHLKGRCPAKKCKALIKYTITDDCIGCTRCAQRCPSDAIALMPYRKHEIDQEKCIRCDTCRQVCPSDAVKVE